MINLPWHTGSWGTPELGISEAIGSIFNKPTTYQGGSNLIGAQPQAPVSVIPAGGGGGGIPTQVQPSGTMPVSQFPQTPQQQTQPSGGSMGNDYVAQWQALGRSGTPPVGWHGESGGGGGGGVDYNDLIQEIYSNVDEMIGSTQAAYGAQQKSLETGKTSQLSELETENQERMAEYAGQRTEAQQTAKEEQATARRTLAEMLMGIQSRYGGTTGTGQAYSEILGRGYFNYLGKVSGALNKTLTNVSNAVSTWKNRVLSEQNKLEASYQDNLAQLQTNLNSDLIKLKSYRTETKIQVLQQYQQQAAQLESQRNQYLQNLALKNLEGRQKMEQLRAEVIYKYLYSSPGKYTGGSTGGSTGTTQTTQRTTGSGIIRLPDSREIGPDDPNYEYWQTIYG